MGIYLRKRIIHSRINSVNTYIDSKQFGKLSKTQEKERYNEDMFVNSSMIPLSTTKIHFINDQLLLKLNATISVRQTINIMHEQL